MKTYNEFFEEKIDEFKEVHESITFQDHFGNVRNEYSDYLIKERDKKLKELLDDENL